MSTGLTYTTNYFCNGSHVNPQSQKFKRGKPLTGVSLERYQDAVLRISDRLNSAGVATRRPADSERVGLDARLGLLIFTLLSVGVVGEQQSIEGKVEQHLATMTPAEKVGQLVMIGFGGTSVNNEIRLWLRERAKSEAQCSFAHIVDLEQTAQLTRGIAELNTGIPAFIALDQEGGNVVRVKDGATVLPGNMTLGATRSPMLAMVSGQSMVSTSRLGFNMNLAPVLDINRILETQ